MRQSSNSLSLGLHSTALNARWFLPLGAWSKILMYIFICVLWIWIHCTLCSEYMWFLSPGSQIQDLDPPNWGQFPSVSSTDLHPSPPHTTPPLIASPILRIHIHEQNTNKYWYSSVYIYDAQCTPCIMDFWQSVTQSRRSVNEEGQRMGGSTYQQIICYNPVQK